MQNKLKRETLPALKLLNHAKIGSIMVTGDNPLTACYVAIGCELVSKNKPIYLAEGTRSNYSKANFIGRLICMIFFCFLFPVVEGEGLLWRNIDNHREPPRELFSLLQGCFRVYSTLESEYMKEAHVVNPNVELAITGTAFEYLLKEQLEFNTVLNHAHIYARMKPDQKQQLVEKLAELGHTVGMCGDGANDCGALKAADVGISLSEAEASIAAPFTSAIPNIGCVIDLLREGRCAMVTSFQAFKYMASYSLIQFSSSMILYSLAALLSNWEFLWIDLFIVMPLAFASEYTGAHHKLSKRKPIPSLISWTVITSLILQNGINLAFQLLAFGLLYTQDWFVFAIAVFCLYFFLSP
jgi:cation-transporting ATPase 13A3/4/5